MELKKKFKKTIYNNPVLFLLFFVLFILLTNLYYSYSDSLIYGGSDGFYYIKISESFPRIADNVEYIKSERFFFPYLLGGISKLFSIGTFATYRIFVFLLAGLIGFFMYQNLKKIKSSNFLIIISLSFFIFNPYIFRFFLAIPTIITDLFFIFSSVLIVHGFMHKNKKNIFLGFAISVLSRQNGIFFLISFLIGKFYFKEKSLFSYKDLIFCVVIFFAATLLNTNYAITADSTNMSSPIDLYKVTLFGIFFNNYTFSQLIKFILFPFLSLAPLMVFYFFQIKKLKKIYLTELGLVILITSVLIFAVAFVSGPVVTGKNITRLINLSYPMLIILINLCLKKGATTSWGNFLIIIVFFTIWSFHPTFSNVAVFDDLKIFFTL